MAEKDQLVAISVAHRVTMSPHEWQWNEDEQQAMAQYCLWAAQRLENIRRVAGGEDWE